MGIRDLSVVPVLLVCAFSLVCHSPSEFKIVFQARIKTPVVQQQSLRHEVRNCRFPQSGRSRGQVLFIWKRLSRSPLLESESHRLDDILVSLTFTTSIIRQLCGWGRFPPRIPCRPISNAIGCKTDEESRLRSLIESSLFPSRVSIRPVIANGDMLELNKLRNIAFSETTTTHVLVLDIDIIPSRTSHSSLST